MIKFVFILDVKSGKVINSKPMRKRKKVEAAIDRVIESCVDSSLVPQQRIEPIRVNATTNIYGQVNDKYILISVFADVSLGSTRYKIAYKNHNNIQNIIRKIGIQVYQRNKRIDKTGSGRDKAFRDQDERNNFKLQPGQQRRYN